MPYGPGDLIRNRRNGALGIVVTTIIPGSRSRKQELVSDSGTLFVWTWHGSDDPNTDCYGVWVDGRYYEWLVIDLALIQEGDIDGP